MNYFILFSYLFISLHLIEYKVNCDCWWTGCQPTTWARRGCSVFNMNQINEEICDGGTGNKYHCCDKENTRPIVPSNSEADSQTERNTDTITTIKPQPQSEDNQPKVNSKANCWWTGCQPTSWAKRGCSVYDMDQLNEETCDGGNGNKYQCCDKQKIEAPNTGKRECWWTGCQPTTWAQRGCSVYQMDEIASDICDGGNKYHCCKK